MQTRTRTQTVVFTDMADYTRSVVNSDREGIRALLAEHQRMVEPVLTRRGGRIVKGLGDSFMALFDSATDAVRACMDLIEAHAPASGLPPVGSPAPGPAVGGQVGSHTLGGVPGFGPNAGGGPSPASGPNSAAPAAVPVTFRASCATGDVEETANDAFGDPVNLSSRINARTPAGEVWISASTWHCMNATEIPWESTGRHLLKGMPDEVEVFRAVGRHQAVLPEVLVAAIRTNRFVVWQAGDPVPVVPPGGHVALVGYKPDSPALAQAVDSLPIVDPSHIWLVAYKLGPAERLAWGRHGRGFIIALPESLNAAVARWSAPVQKSAGSDTIILDGGSLSVVNLVVAGLCLPAVPYAEVVAGYSYDLLSDGRWVNRSDRAVLRVDVQQTGATLTVLVPGVSVGGSAAGVNSAWPLRPGLNITSPACNLRFVATDKEGYIGALVGDTQMRLGVGEGQRVELGREPNHPGLLLPDRNNQDNIRWCPGPRAARARERGFTMDKSLTGRRQTALAIEGQNITVVPLHETCPTLLLGPAGVLTRVPGAQPARVDDMLLLGTTVVAIRDASS